MSSKAWQRPLPLFAVDACKQVPPCETKVVLFYILKFALQENWRRRTGAKKLCAGRCAGLGAAGVSTCEAVPSESHCSESVHDSHKLLCDSRTVVCAAHSCVPLGLACTSRRATHSLQSSSRCHLLLIWCCIANANNSTRGDVAARPGRQLSP